MAVVAVCHPEAPVEALECWAWALFTLFIVFSIGLWNLCNLAKYVCFSNTNLSANKPCPAGTVAEGRMRVLLT